MEEEIKEDNISESPPESNNVEGNNSHRSLMTVNYEE